MRFVNAEKRCWPFDDKRDSSAWMDWRWQLAASISAPEELGAALVSRCDLAGMNAARARFPMFVRPYYLSLIDTGDPDDPLLRTILPDPRELIATAGLADDPIGEESHSPLPGVIRRYPDRALLLVSGRCPTNCRHCTRRQLGRGKVAPLSALELDAALDYLRAHPEIRDVILSGGDPLLLDDAVLESILARLRGIGSVEIIRIGTRVPAALPMRIDRQLARTLARFHPLFVNTQFNHPREVTAEATAALGELVDAGLVVGNQSVLLRGVNDSKETVLELCRALLRARVRPYYLFLSDLWPGLEHLRTPLSSALEIAAHLRGRLSGLGIPQLVIDLPGGLGKVPIGPQHLVSYRDGLAVLRASNGQLIDYVDP